MPAGRGYGLLSNPLLAAGLAMGGRSKFPRSFSQALGDGLLAAKDTHTENTKLGLLQDKREEESLLNELRRKQLEQTMALAQQKLDMERSQRDTMRAWLGSYGRGSPFGTSANQPRRPVLGPASAQEALAPGLKDQGSPLGQGTTVGDGSEGDPISFKPPAAEPDGSAALNEHQQGLLAWAQATGRHEDAVSFLNSLKPDSTSFQKNYEFLIGQGLSPEAALATLKSGTSVTVNTKEKSPPVKRVMGDIQQKLLGGISSLHRVSRMARDFQTDFLTYFGKGKAFAAEKADKLNMATDDQKAFLRARTKFIQTMGREFNQYRQDITGAAAANTEIERLRQDMMNINQGPTQFLASLEQYRDEVLYQQRLRRKILRDGFDVSAEEYGKKWQRQYADREDDDMDLRMSELLGSGLNRGMAMRMLLAEGYGMKERAAALRKEGRNAEEIARILYEEGYGVGVDE